MGFTEVFQDVADWVWENYPAYKGWRLVSFAWDYYVASSVQEIISAADEAMNSREFMCRDDLEGIVKTVIPPAGHAYCTFQKGNIRVGINVPCHVFQKQPQPRLTSGLCFGGDMPLLTPADLAQRLRISSSKARQLAAPGGPIPCARIGRLIRFNEEDIQEYEQQCRSTTIKAAVDIALNSTASLKVEESGLQSYFQKLGIKPRRTSSTAKKAAASMR